MRVCVGYKKDLDNLKPEEVVKYPDGYIYLVYNSIVILFDKIDFDNPDNVFEAGGFLVKKCGLKSDEMGIYVIQEV